MLSPSSDKPFLLNILTILCLSTTLTIATMSDQARAETHSSTESFAPSWSLLNSEQKQYFISGYLKGLADSSKITDVAIEFVQQNPRQAVQGLNELKKLYDLSSRSAIEVAPKVDAFYADPKNKDKPLSLAISAVRSAR